MPRMADLGIGWAIGVRKLRSERASSESAAREEAREIKSGAETKRRPSARTPQMRSFPASTRRPRGDSRSSNSAGKRFTRRRYSGFRLRRSVSGARRVEQPAEGADELPGIAQRGAGGPPLQRLVAVADHADVAAFVGV